MATFNDTRFLSLSIKLFGQPSRNHAQITGIKHILIGHLLNNRICEKQSRHRRDNSGSIDIKAVQATINDHRTMIDDHRVMINNIMNNSMNVDTIQQAVSNHYSNAAPARDSWRDMALIFLLFIAMIEILYFCVCQVK